MVIIKVDRGKGEEWVINRDGQLTKTQSDAYLFNIQEAVNLCLKKAREKRKSKVLWWVEERHD